MTYPRCLLCNTVSGFVNRVLIYPSSVGDLHVCEWCQRTYQLGAFNYAVD